MPVADGAPDCNSLVILGQRRGFTVDDCSAPPPPTGSVTLSKVQMWQVNSDINRVQEALAGRGYTIVVDGYFGPQSKSVYSQWQQSLGFTGSDASGFPGNTSLTALGNAEGFTVVNDGVTPAGEPTANYSRLTYTSATGAVINQRTKTLLDRAVVALADSYSWSPYLVQGSYHPGVSGSAGTHDGGGVVDIRTSTMTLNGQNLCVQALREVGFAAWLRTPAEGFSTHIHAVAIGDWEMDPTAEDQVQDYFNGRNGLANNGPDTLPSSYAAAPPSWATKYNR